MAFFTWSDNLSVGIARIDEQHKKLVALVNSLHQAMSEGKGKDALGKILSELIQYTQTHFAMEESLMSANKYPELPSHKNEHALLTKKALELQAQFQKGDVMTLTIPVFDFLKDWLTKHILGTDKKYAPFLISKGVK